MKLNRRVTIITRFSGIMFSLLLLGGLAACSDDNNANISEIPSLFITDMYPLSMHAVAIYGKILGEPANYLITQLIPDSNGESEETTTYTYTLDNRGIVTSCHAVVRHIRNGYEQDYTRTVNYTIE